MDTQILKKYQEVRPYIDNARKCADLHKTELGFLTPSAYEEQALQGKLWVCIDKEHKTYLGHLLFGGKYPYLKIFQLVVQPEYRKKMIPFSLIAELEEFGIENSYLNITARVADELPANKFWDFVGLKLIRQVKGGQARGRKINLRSKELETTSLLSLIEWHNRHDSTLVNYSNSPVCTSNLYVIDLNVLIDITRNRTYKKQASAIIRAGLNNYIRIAVTDEFINELRRTNTGRISDPLLELACELPTIRVDNKSALNELVTDLRKIIFPDRDIGRINATQDVSDLIHIATCIISKADGFITREKAILRAKDKLFSRYNLEILSPYDIEEPDATPLTNILVTNISEFNNDLKIDSVNDADLSEILQYLSDIRLKQGEIDEILNKGTTGASRQRVVLTHNGNIIGFASWDAPSNITKEISAYVLISEDNPVAEKAIDHILESITRSNNSDVRKLTLYFCSDQIKTKSTSILRGFRSGKASEGTILTSMTKISFSGVISSENWRSFVRKFKTFTRLSLPDNMQICRSIDDKCLTIMDEINGKEVCLSLFELETLISPGILLPAERRGILLPIQPSYAIELGIYESSQGSLLPKQEAFLHIEKAYFRKNINTKIYERGMIVFFYVSGKGEHSQSVIGCARITYSEANSLETIAGRFYRQGVLPLRKLTSLTDKNKLIHVITFDNFCVFQRAIPLTTLKKNNHISKRNLITGEIQNPVQTQAILEYAFKTRE